MKETDWASYYKVLFEDKMSSQGYCTDSSLVLRPLEDITAIFLPSSSSCRNRCLWFHHVLYWLAICFVLHRWGSSLEWFGTCRSTSNEFSSPIISNVCFYFVTFNLYKQLLYRESFLNLNLHDFTSRWRRALACQTKGVLWYGWPIRVTINWPIYYV